MAKGATKACQGPFICAMIYMHTKIEQYAGGNCCLNRLRRNFFHRLDLGGALRGCFIAVG